MSAGSVVETVAAVARSSPALSGCAVLLLLLGLAALVFPFFADDLLAGVVVSWQEEVEAALPADLTEDERTALAWAFEDAIYTVRTGDPDQEALARVRERVKGGADLDRRGVVELTRDLRAVAGRPAGGDAESGDR